MKGGSFMANTEIFLRNIFGTTRPNTFVLLTPREIWSRSFSQTLRDLVLVL